MMRIKFQYIFSWTNMMALPLMAQETSTGHADEKYEKYAYIDAIKTYERLAKKGYSSPELFKRLANSYYFNARLEEAGKWYGELFKLKDSIGRSIIIGIPNALNPLKIIKRRTRCWLPFMPWRKGTPGAIICGTTKLFGKYCQKLGKIYH